MNTAPQLSHIGKYRLIATIGHGGMAHIHLALMAGVAGFNKLLVIKALREDIAAGTEDFVTMFLDEARLAARLNHPNIVQTYEVGQAGGRYFIAMEYLEGQAMKTVERRLSPGGLPLPMQLRIVSEVAKGLHSAHSLTGFNGEHLGVVHRDVSPHNVFLTYDGQVKLLDFGIAKASNALHLTKVGVIKGKADYIAPEQIRGDEVDCRADVFSLGVMLWEALAARRFAGGPHLTEVTKMHQRLTAAEDKLREVNPAVPERLAEICERAIALDPAHRHQTALELSREIDEYLADSSLHPNAQQLADLIGPPFQRERDELRRMIDAQMKLALDPMTSFESTTGTLPLLPISRTSQPTSLWQVPELTGLPGQLSPTTSSSMPSQIAATVFPEAGRRSAPWPFVVGAMLIAVAAGGLLALRSEAPASAAVAGAAQRDAASDPTRSPTRVEPSQPGPQAIRLRINASPSNAQATIDGANISLPFDAEVPLAREAHEVVISAEGFIPHRTILPYDRDQTLRITLDPALQPKRTVVAHAAVAPSTQNPNNAALVPPIPPGGAKPRDTVEPGMDFRRLNVERSPAATNIVLEEDPYR